MVYQYAPRLLLLPNTSWLLTLTFFANHLESLILQPLFKALLTKLTCLRHLLKTPWFLALVPRVTDRWHVKHMMRIHQKAPQAQWIKFKTIKQIRVF